MIYLDNAATTYPKPQSVLRAVSQNMQGANPGRGGHSLAIRAAENVYKCRVKAAKLLGVENAGNVIFTSGCTMSINMVIKGLLKKGDHVVVSDMEHNAVMRPLEAMSQYGIKYTVASVCENDEETISNFRDALNEHTRLVICTQISNVWGIRLPVERITAMCHEYNIPVMVDAAQSAGIVNINMMNSKFDYLCVPAHKGLYGVMGSGLLVVRDPKNLQPIIHGGTGSDSLLLTQPEYLPDKFESGTPNYIGITALSAGIDFINSIGEEKIHRHEIELLSMLYDNLSRNKKIKLYTPRPNEKSGGVLSFNVKDKTSEETAAYLNSRGIAVRAGLHCSPLAHKHFGTENIGAVRIAPSYFTTYSDIYTLSRVLSAGSAR